MRDESRKSVYILTENQVKYEEPRPGYIGGPTFGPLQDIVLLGSKLLYCHTWSEIGTESTLVIGFLVRDRYQHELGTAIDILLVPEQLEGLVVEALSDRIEGAVNFRK